MSIVIGSKYGDARKQAARDQDPHGLTPQTIEQLSDRAEKFLPGLANSHGQASKQFFDGLMPDGADLTPSKKQANLPGGSVNFAGGGFGGGGGGTAISPQRPYQPEFECVIENTQITMANGSLKRIQDIKIGDEVLDKTGSIQKVEKHWCSGTPKELVELVLWGSTELHVTTNHNLPVWAWPRICACGCNEEVAVGKVFKLSHYKSSLNIDVKVVDGSKKYSNHQRRIRSDHSPVQKLQAENIRQSDFLMIPRKFDPIKTNVEEEKARLLGYYIAEGNLAKNRSDLPYKEFELTFGIHEEDTWVKDCLNIFSKFDIQCTAEKKEDKSVFRLRTRQDNKNTADWLFEHGGHLSREKLLSKEVMRWPVKLKWELIKGLIRGDGSQHYAITRTKGKEGTKFEVTFYTASKTLSTQTHLILAQLGFPARMQFIKGKYDEKRGFNRNDGYNLVVTGTYARELSERIWGDDSTANQYPRKNEISHKCLVDDEYIYVPVKSTKLIKNASPVYNMTVSGDHSYLIENIGSYNSPDRQQYPVHRILANRYWRLFYKLDPVIGNCIDMISSMPFSEFQLTGEGVTGEIKEAFETMCQETNVLSTLEYMVKEFMVIGECVPHNFFDESKGIWTYTALHNPDQLEVIDAPFIKMDPIVEFIPDDRLRAVLTSNNHLLRGVRDQMPAELLSRLIARQNIPLSPINMTFIPRRMHPYDTRGTSIISRMWRILMYEDSIYNASISTARRHAGPLKVAKLGNPQTGWIPSQEHEKRLLQLLAQAETDVNSWLVYHYGINFELVGTTDRIMNISQHHDVIERIKLIALGISKSFLHGEVTYASSITGLSVFLQRMKSIRTFFVNTWLIPKFFKPIAKINGWIKRDQKELNFRYRVKRSQRELEQQNRYIVPKIEWDKSLDSTVDSELVNAMKSLEQMGIQFSKTTKYATVGRKYEEELHKLEEEQQYEEKLNKYIKPQDAQAGPGGGIPGMPGGGPPIGGGPSPTGAPDAPSSGMPSPEGGGNVPNAPGGAGAPGGEVAADKTGDGGGSGPSGKKDPAVKDTNSMIWDHKGRCGNWSASEITELSNLLEEGHTNSALWGSLDGERFRGAINAGDVWEVIELIEEHLLDEGYPKSDIKQLKEILDKEGVLKNIADGETMHLKDVENNLGDEMSNLNDMDAMNKLSAQLEGRTSEVSKLGGDDALFVGHGNESQSTWSGDISNLLNNED